MMSVPTITPEQLAGMSTRVDAAVEDVLRRLTPPLALAEVLAIAYKVAEVAHPTKKPQDVLRIFFELTDRLTGKEKP